MTLWSASSEKLTCCIARGVNVEDVNRTEYDIAINARSIDIVDIYVRGEISASAVPVAVRQETKDLRCLSAWTATFSDFCRQEHSLGQCTMLAIDSEEGRAVDLWIYQWTPVLHKLDGSQPLPIDHNLFDSSTGLSHAVQSAIFDSEY